MPPEVTLSGNEYKGVAGKAIKAEDLISKVDDKAGIESVEFAENQIEVEAQGEDLLDAISLKYDTAGQYTAVVTVTDKSGNTTKKEIAMKIVEDYLAHVSGIQDLTVEQGATIDWLAGVTKDKKILEIKADASKVDINTAGEYTLTYIIAGDDQETTVQKEVKVTVVTPQKAQSLANSGSTVKTTGGTKKKASTSSGSSLGKKSSGSSSKGSGSKNNSGSNGYTPGQSWEGTTTGSGTIDNYNGNTYEDFTW